MRIITQKGLLFIIKFEYNPAISTQVKNIPGHRWDPRKKVWTVPATARIAVERLAYANGFQFGEAPEEVFDVPELPQLNVDIQLKREMYPYQKQGVAFNIEKRFVIVGDKPGLGKTVQSIASVIGADIHYQDKSFFPCLVICPSSLKINWKREWEMWSDKRAMILQDSVKNSFHRYWEHGMVDVFIVNYESLKKYFVAKMPGPDEQMSIKNMVFKSQYVNLFKSMIVDESHRVKSFSTQQTKFTKGIAENKEMILLCTGTPVVNKPVDLVAQLAIINQLPAFGGYTKFLSRYCSGRKGASHLAELNNKLRLNCFYQRKKEDVLKDLPDKVRQLMYCEIDSKSRELYAAAVKDFKKYLANHVGLSEEKIDTAVRGEALVKINYLKKISALGKLNDVFEHVDNILESGEKLVLFAHLKDVIDKVKSKYPKAVSITGSDSSNARQHAVDAFQNDDSVKLIVCSMTAAGVGLTLTAASNVAFIELGWTGAGHEQCEDRCHRIGQKGSVQCTYFLGKDTIDEDIYDIIDSKRKLAAAVTGNEEMVQENVISALINLFKQKEV